MALVLCFSTLLIACGGSSDEESAPKEEPSSTETTEAPVKPFRLGTFIASENGAWDRMGVRQDFYAEENLEVELTEAGSPDQLRALLAGRLDMANLSVGVAVAAMAEGAEIVCIGTGANIGDAIYASKDIESLDDVVGKRILTTAVGEQPHTVITEILKRNDIDPADANFQASNVSEGERVAALIAGQTDLTIAGISFSKTVEETDNVHMIGLVKDELGGVPGTMIFVRKESLEKDKELLVRGAKAFVRGIRHAYDDPEDTLAFLKEILKSNDDAFLGRVVEDFTKINRIDANLALSPELVEETLTFYSTQAAGKVTADSFANYDIREAVLDELGEYEPGA